MRGRRDRYDCGDGHHGQGRHPSEGSPRSSLKTRFTAGLYSQYDNHRRGEKCQQEHRQPQREADEKLDDQLRITREVPDESDRDDSQSHERGDEGA